jgi:hypothetical protein
MRRRREAGVGVVHEHVHEGRVDESQGDEPGGTLKPVSSPHAAQGREISAPMLSWMSAMR